MPGTQQSWETCSDYAQQPIMLFIIDCLSKNDSFVSKRYLSLSKTLAFYYCFQNSPLSEAGLAD